MRPYSPALWAGLLAACATDKPTSSGSDTPSPPEWCAGPTTHLWDPVAATEVQLFPDGTLEVDDPGSPTGRRISVSTDRAPWADDLPDILSDAVLSLGELSGFGTLGGHLVRFDAPVTGWPTSAADSTTNNAFQLVDLSTAPPTRVPFEVEVLEDGLSAIFWPLRPLAMGAEHALVVTTHARAADGSCIAPAEATRALLEGTAEPGPLAESSDRYQQALHTLGLAPADISALSVYTVHNDVSVVQTLADQVAAEDLDWTTPPTCSESDGLRTCTGTFPLADYRNDLGAVDLTVEPRIADAPVTLWIPSGEGPWPIVMFGHGLGSSRGEGGKLARQMGDIGFAVVSLDAVEHGDHPWAQGTDGDDALRFLGLDLTAFALDTRTLRGNFDQTVLDRRRLLALLQAHPDLHGTANLDPHRIGYLGISLGAILAPELLAVAPEVQAAVLSVGGARLISIATGSGDFAAFEPVIEQAVGSAARYDRLQAVAQHTVDPADPGAWAPRVFTDRTPPHLLAHVGLYDEVVPPETGHALARAFDLPQLTPVYEPVELLTVVDASVVSANLDGTTAAFTQFDQVTVDGASREANHGNTPDSDEAWLQMMTFLETWIETGTPDAIDSTGSR